jgi:hypothetical protein
MPKSGSAQGGRLVQEVDWTRVEAWSRAIESGDATPIDAEFRARGCLDYAIRWNPMPMLVQTLQLRVLFEYWNEIRGPASMPLRARVDLRELSGIIGYVILLVPVEDGRDFRYDFFGGVIAAVTGRTPVGKLTSNNATAPHDVESALAAYRAVYRRGEPVAVTRGAVAVKMAQRWCGLILPLADEEGNVSGLLCGGVPLGLDGHPVYMQY